MTSVRRQYLQRSASSRELREFNTTQERDNRQEIWDSAQANASDRQCIECIQAVPVFSPEELDVGDHVVFDREVYTHHGIIVSVKGFGIFKIIEATNTPSGFASATSTSKSFGGKAKIMSSWKALDFLNDRILVVVYKNGRFSKMDTVLNAILYYRDVKERGYRYNLFTNNCEHFATYCATGQHFSLQVAMVKFVPRLFFSVGISCIYNKKERNEELFKNKIICEPCYKMIRNLLSVGCVPIRGVTDIMIGDIIRYLYFGFWHDAVILRITKASKGWIVCNIAHYAFCGLLSRKTIKEGTITIKFRSKFYKLDYALPRYDIYEPGDVVKRAQSRIGEQLFRYFSNTSSHFARWCKLKHWMSELIVDVEGIAQHHGSFML